MAQVSSCAGFSPSWTEQSDEELILAHPDRRAVVGELCRRHRTFCIRVAMGFLSNADDAEDAVQDAFLRVHNRLDSFRHHSTFRSWLTRIVINQCRMVVRTRRGAQVLSLSEAIPGATPCQIGSCDKTPEQMHYDRQLEAALRQTLEGLPVHHRLPLAMQVVYGLDIKTIARHLDLTPQATKTRLHRARLALRGRLLPWLPVRGWRDFQVLTW